MTGSAWMLSLVLVPGLHDPIGSPKEWPIQNETVLPSSAEAKAIDRLDDPLGTIDGNFSGGPSLCNQMFRYLLGCQDQIELLIDTKAAVNHDLLANARTTESLRVRYRATYILTQRRCKLVATVLDRMCESSDEEERYLAWNTYRMALSDKKLKPPEAFGRALKLYVREQNSEIWWEMVHFFGEARAKEAAPALIERVEKSEDSANEIWALGEIGDPKAVPAIIKAFVGKLEEDRRLEALGKLATPEAVDFIIDHLDTYGAVKALCRTKSDKALPVLKKHLEHLQQAKGKEKDYDIRDTRIAIIRLSTDDPREALLHVAEDRREDAETRFEVLRVLQEYDTTPFERRILKVFKESDDADIKRGCIWILENGTADGITGAMLDHVLNWKGTASKNTLATENALRNALNKRLNRSFRKYEDLRAYAEELRKLKDQENEPGPSRR